MTYAELFAKLNEDVPAARSFNIEVQTWRHGRDWEPSTTWQIYLAPGSDWVDAVRFEGPTAESVYLAFTNSMGVKETIYETSDNVDPEEITQVTS